MSGSSRGSTGVCVRAYRREGRHVQLPPGLLVGAWDRGTVGTYVGRESGGSDSWFVGSQVAGIGGRRMVD